MIKLLGIDMDGTVLNDEVTVSDENREAIKKAIDKGVIVIPTTGRALSMVPREVLNLPGVQFAITSNGAAIYNTETKEVVYEQPLTKDQLKGILNILKDYDTFDEIIIDGRSYAPEEQFKDLNRFVESKYYNLYDDLVTPLSQETLNKAFETANVEKIAFRLPLEDESKKEEIFKRLEEIPNLILLSQAEGTQEITNIDANKGEALAAIANQFGLDCSQVMAIGDSENDISMLTFADTGVAMGQAKDHVKEFADYITDTNNNNGVAKAIDRFIILGEQEEDDIPVELVEKVKKVNKVK